MQVVVARIGKAHGLRGEVTVQVLTDSSDDRFVPGAAFATEPELAGPLVVRTARDHNGVLLLRFEDTDDRTGAEELRGIKLLDVVLDDDDDEDAWYERDLVGLTAVTVTDGNVGEVGEVIGLRTGGAQDLLVLRLTDGREALVPFVAAIVPEVDIEGGRVVLDPPTGLFDLDQL